MSMTKKTMTVEEMESRWPEIPPYKVKWIELHICDSEPHIEWDINQDTIKEIREYLDAVEETMNG